MSQSKRILNIALGSVCVALAGVGLLIPVLPTTPFLLLAAFFYARSSQRFYTWLVTNRWFGVYLRNYREGRGMSLHHKRITIGLVWLSIGSTVLFADVAVWLKVILLSVALGVTIHLVQIRSVPTQRHIPAPDAETETPLN